MKVGTLSLNINTDDLNYGAILHSWAFQQQLKKFEEVEKAEIIDYIPIGLENFKKNAPVTSFMKMKRWRSAVKTFISRPQYMKRLKAFEDFTKNELDVSECKYTQKSLESSEIGYDCLICESDVIWSPRVFGGRFDRSFFLDLENMRDKKKIIYAASMANGMKKSQTEEFRKLVKAPDHISCRESYAVNFVNKNTDRKAVQVVDPVLLLDAKEYDCICAPRVIDEPYLLLYIPLDYNNKYQVAAEKYAKKHGLKVVEISYYVWYGLKHKVISSASVQEFLSLIKYADTVFTNSFHAVCFSLLFKKDFYAFERTTGKKTEDICRWTGLEERYMNVDNFSEKPPVDFEKAWEKIDEKKMSSLRWLSQSLGSRKYSEDNKKND